jgi:hypothetical protein
MSEEKRTEPVEYAGTQEGSWAEALAYPLGCVGALVGVAIGAVVTRMGMSAGVYALIVVGPLAGFTARALARRGDVLLGVMVGAIAALGGLWTEWWLQPFIVDNSLGYFVTHLGSIRPFDLLIIGVGAVVAFFMAARK